LGTAKNAKEISVYKKGENKMKANEAVQATQEYVNVPLAELVESMPNPRKTFDEERLEDWPRVSAAKESSRRSSLAGSTAISKSFRERGGIAPRRERGCRKFPYALLSSATTKLSKPKSLKI
jgi:hypothetical protein